MRSLRHERGNWDAENYHKVSSIQETWAIELLAKRKWNGNEVLIDAGCGSGRVTRIISNILKNGKIYAIDLDQNMIEKAKINLTITKMSFLSMQTYLLSNYQSK